MQLVNGTLGIPELSEKEVSASCHKISVFMKHS